MTNTHVSKNRAAVLLCGILGCILMGGSDWLMIYGDAAYEGKLAWLTAGVAQIAPWQNSLALLLAFPAVVLYSIALFGIRHYLQKESSQKTYAYLTALGLTPWLALHLFYIMILYLFAWMQGNGGMEAALAAGEALFAHFSWVILLSEVFMLLPFFYWLISFAAGKSIYSRWMALNNPLLIYLILKGLTLLLPVSGFRLAFTNGLMSESMAIWFLIFLFVRPSRR